MAWRWLGVSVSSQGRAGTCCTMSVGRHCWSQQDDEEPKKLNREKNIIKKNSIISKTKVYWTFFFTFYIKLEIFVVFVSRRMIDWTDFIDSEVNSFNLFITFLLIYMFYFIVEKVNVKKKDRILGTVLHVFGYCENRLMMDDGWTQEPTGKRN